MNNTRYLFAALVAVLLTAVAAYAGDPTGTWTWKRQFQDREFVTTMKLALQDGQLTGTVTGFGDRQNAISNAKFENDEISFDVVIEFNGNKRTQKYHGKLDGDAINGTIQMQGRDGGTRELEWQAKRDS